MRFYSYLMVFLCCVYLNSLLAKSAKRSPSSEQAEAERELEIYADKLKTPEDLPTFNEVFVEEQSPTSIPDEEKLPVQVQAQIRESELKILYWPAQEFANRDFDLDRAALILSEFDLAIFKDLKVTVQSDPSLVLARLIRERKNELYCRAWVSRPSKGRTVVLWKNSRMGVINERGQLSNECDEKSLHWELRKKTLLATFQIKKTQQFFALAEVELKAKPKKDKIAFEVLPVFKNFGSSTWPVLIVSEFRLTTNQSVFAEIKKLGFERIDKKSLKLGTVNFFHKDLLFLRLEPQVKNKIWPIGVTFDFDDPKFQPGPQLELSKPSAKKR